MLAAAALCVRPLADLSVVWESLTAEHAARLLTPILTYFLYRSEHRDDETETSTRERAPDGP